MNGFLSHLSFNLSGFEPVDFPSRAAHRDRETMNTVTEKNVYQVKRAPLRRIVFTTSGEYAFPLVTATPTPKSSKPPDAEPSCTL